MIKKVVVITLFALLFAMNVRVLSTTWSVDYESSGLRTPDRVAEFDEVMPTAGFLGGSSNRGDLVVPSGTANTSEVFGAVNPWYSISDSPWMRLPWNTGDSSPVVPPEPREVGEVKDPTGVVVYDVVTGEEIRLPSDHLALQSVESGLGSEIPYQGLLSSGNITTESIIGDDDRTRVLWTTFYPWRTIVKLFIWEQGVDPDDPLSEPILEGSGAIIDGYHVLTAGHCVYDPDIGGWAGDITVVPGLNGTYMPFNRARATLMRTYSGWVDDQYTEADWALITLDRNIGLFTGWMGRMTADPSDPVYTGQLSTAGYPGELGNPLGTWMYQDSDLGRSANEYNHWYYLDTTPGQSGSPVWVYQAGERYILTVHTSGVDWTGTNHGTRLNEDKYDRIITWVNEDTPPTDYADLIDDGGAYRGFVPSTTVRAATYFSVWSRVRNIGTASSGPFRVNYYASEDSIIEQGDHLIGAVDVASIPPFSSGDVSWSGPFPSGIPTGYYYVGVIIDIGHEVAEFKENNNKALIYDFITLHVLNNPPVADANGPYVGTAEVPITFDGYRSYDLDGAIVSYDWDFGDGNTGTGYYATHTYSQPGTYTVTLNVTDNDGETSDTDITTATIGERLPWYIEPVDSTGNTGWYSSIALDSNGNPHISYQDGYPNQDLKYARWDGTAWNTETVDSAGKVGWFSSIALDSSDNPHISYYDSTNLELRYARWDGTAWNIGTVDSDGDVGLYCSIALDSSDNPHISYFDVPNKNLKYARWNGLTWIIEPVDSTGWVGEYTSLALDALDRPHISYRDYTNLDLKYAYWDGSAWSIETVDSDGDVGKESSIALDSSDYPHISYYNETDRDLKYARWGGTAWIIETVDQSGDVGRFSSVALDSGDNPHISYFQDVSYVLKYARWTSSGGWAIQTVDQAARSYTSLALDSGDNPHISYFGLEPAALKYAKLMTWIIETVDSAEYVGVYSSLALDSLDRPHISHYDNLNRDLKYARWDGTAWNIGTVDSDGDVGAYTSIALDSSDYPHISYFDVTNLTNGNLKYARWDGTAWVIETVDSADYVGQYTSIALDSKDRPHISYYDKTHGDLKYARWGGTAWSIETVDSFGNVGQYTSIALDSLDRPHISYHDFSGKYLKYARWDGSAWSIETVDGYVGAETSLALDSQDRPHISYYDDANDDLKYAWWNGTAWSTQTVDPAAEYIGRFSSIALDSRDYPHISYWDLTNADLKYARWTGTAWNIMRIDSSIDVGHYTSIALDSGDNPHISYQHLTNKDLKYATTAKRRPVADANGPYDGTEGQPIIFTSLGSSDPDGTIVSYQWDFGDGNNGTGASPTHTYLQEGTYTVTLTVIDNHGLIGADTATATISDTEPTASFSGAVTIGQEPLAVEFTDLSISYDGITGWEWDFDNDGTVDSTIQNPTHTYEQQGVYDVTLKVYEGDGDTDTETKIDYIIVLDAKPIADFSGSPRRGKAPLTVYFTDLSTSHDGIVSWIWNFGDGDTSTEQNPTHTYANDGTYTVSLTAYEIDGGSATKTRGNYIFVWIINVVFEEAHYSLFTVGGNPAGGVPGGYAEFAYYLIGNGYFVSTIDLGTTIDSTVLAPVDVLVIAAPQMGYSTSEIDAIETWVKGGGTLLLISEWGNYGLRASTIAARFGITQPFDAIFDYDEYVSMPAYPYYDGANLMVHPVTAGVTRVEMYASDGFASAPQDEIPLIITDFDGTAAWYSDGSPALGVSVMSAIDRGGTAGSGRLIVIADSNLWDSVYDFDVDGTANFYDSDNEILALNVIDWLSAARHDVAVTDVTPSKTAVGEGYSMSINVTVENEGAYTETFDVTAFTNAQGINDGLAGYWSFDEGKGATARDGSGNGNDGTRYGATWTDGKSVKALNFDGFDDYVTAPFIALYNRSFTITMWINAKNLPTLPSDAALFTQYHNDSLGKYLHIVIRDSLPYFGFWIDDLTGNTPLTINTWCHLAFVYDYTSNYKYIYINGTLDAYQESMGAYQGSSRNTIIGGYLGFDIFNGTIDEVRIYNRALSQQEIEAVASSGAIQTQTITLTSGNYTTLTFTWTPANLTHGNYTISAVADTVPGETDTDNNTYIDGTVFVTITGDLNGDGTVDASDLFDLSKAYGSSFGDSNWNSNCDFNEDKKVDASDLFDLSKNYGKTI